LDVGKDTNIAARLIVEARSDNHGLKLKDVSISQGKSLARLKRVLKICA
jgi:hypothetical protein